MQLQTACCNSTLRMQAERVCTMQDRIIDFTFGTGEATHHIILELYSQVGNTVIWDPTFGNFCGMLLERHKQTAGCVAHC
jgi:hypothetical protein